jgi:hypothetical protein
VTEMGYTYSVPERVVFALTTLYFLLQVLISLVGWGAVKTLAWFVGQSGAQADTFHDKTLDVVSEL